MAASEESRARHAERFRKVSTRYPRRVAEAYGGDLDRAMADSDEQVAATVAAWERDHGLRPRDWAAIGIHERDELMGAAEIVTYQLANKGNPDVILRDLNADTSITDLVSRRKDAFELFEGRVAVKVDEGGEPRPLTRDETGELEAALQRVTGSEISVHPAVGPR